MLMRWCVQAQTGRRTRAGWVGVKGVCQTRPRLDKGSSWLVLQSKAGMKRRRETLFTSHTSCIAKEEFQLQLPHYYSFFLGELTSWHTHTHFSVLCSRFFSLWFGFYWFFLLVLGKQHEVYLMRFRYYVWTLIWRMMLRGANVGLLRFVIVYWLVGSCELVLRLHETFCVCLVTFHLFIWAVLVICCLFVSRCRIPGSEAWSLQPRLPVWWTSMVFSWLSETYEPLANEDSGDKTWGSGVLFSFVMNVLQGKLLFNGAHMKSSMSENTIPDLIFLQSRKPNVKETDISDLTINRQQLIYVVCDQSEEGLVSRERRTAAQSWTKQTSLWH